MSIVGVLCILRARGLFIAHVSIPPWP